MSSFAACSVEPRLAEIRKLDQPKQGGIHGGNADVNAIHEPDTKEKFMQPRRDQNAHVPVEGNQIDGSVSIKSCLHDARR